MKFTKNEIMDILISTFVLALAFSHFNLAVLPIMIFIIAVAFLPHELIGHKLIAQRYGCEAEYRKWNFGLLIGLVSGMFGFVFAAPGAVYISPFAKNRFAFTVNKLGIKEYGIISLGGPLVNIVIGFALVAAHYFYSLDILLSAAQVSFFLAFFNLMPIPPLDGIKVLIWNKFIWVAAIAVSLVGYFLL